MSTHWGYACRTDGASSEHWLNHGERELVAAWDLRQPIALITRDGGVEAPEILGAGAGPAYFLTEHGEHDVVLENEYGDELTIDEARAGISPAIARGVRVDDLRLVLGLVKERRRWSASDADARARLEAAAQ